MTRCNQPFIMRRHHLDIQGFRGFFPHKRHVRAEFAKQLVKLRSAEFVVGCAKLIHRVAGGLELAGNRLAHVRDFRRH